MKTLYQIMEEKEADGISFYQMFLSPENFQNNVICSFTKEQFKNQPGYPKSNYVFWKIINGKKVFLK